MAKAKKKKYSASDKAILGIGYVLLGAFVLSILVPLLYVVIASFMDPNVLNSQGISFDVRKWTIDAYRRVLENNMIWRGFANSFFYSLVFTIISVLVTLLAAYPMSKKEFVGRNFFNVIFLITMFFGGGMIPTFILINQLHLVNTIWAILLPGAFNVWNMILARTYYQSIPKELREASAIDGATEIEHFFKIMMPVCKPIIAVLALWSFVGMWNSYFDAMIYLSETAAIAAGTSFHPCTEYTAARNDRRYPEYCTDGKGSGTSEICYDHCIKFTASDHVSILPEIF